jgi:hypothetical protein
MSISSRITEITTHLENNWRSIEALTGTASVDKNIENIASVLDNLYETLPKSTGTGESLSLSTLPGKMKVNLLGNTSQTGTPTPSSPIPVNVVSGDNTIDICGKNLLNQSEYMSSRTTNTVNFTNNGDGTFNVSGTASSSFTWNILDVGDINLESGKTYTLYSSVPYNSNTFNLSIPYKQDGTQKYLTANNSVTTSGTITDVKLALYIPSGTSVSATNVKLMLVEGNLPGDYEAYIGTSYPVNLPVKNLVQNNLTSGSLNGIDYTVNADKSITLSGTANAITWLILNTNVPLPAGTYTMSQGYTGNDVRMYSTGLGVYTLNGESTVTKTTSVSGDVSINIPNGTVISSPITIKPMIEKGTKANTYTPYGTAPIELCKISTYKDSFFKAVTGNSIYDNLDSATKETLDYGEWYLEKKIGKIESYNGETITTDFISTTGQKTTGATIYYGLSSPTYTKITGTLKDELEAVWRANSYNGTTNISQVNDDLPFNLSVTALGGE